MNGKDFVDECDKITSVLIPDLRAYFMSIGFSIKDEGGNYHSVDDLITEFNTAVDLRNRFPVNMREDTPETVPSLIWHDIDLLDGNGKMRTVLEICKDIVGQKIENAALEMLRYDLEKNIWLGSGRLISG